METIQFYLNDKLVGETNFHDFSTSDSRDQLAYDLRIRDYNNFKILDQKTQTVRFDANTLIIDNTPFGILSGKRYVKKVYTNYFSKEW